MSIFYSLSEYDLQKLDWWYEGVETDNPILFFSELYKNGMDVKRGVGVRTCLHRTLHNTEYNGRRFEGFERQDNYWLKSGCSTLENIIDSEKDEEQRKDLRIMSAQPSNYVEEVIKQAVEKGVL